MTADEKAQKEQPVGYYFWNNAKKITEIKKKGNIAKKLFSV